MNGRTLSLAFFTALLALSGGCSKNEDRHDASGVFEARETIIAAEISGQIRAMPIEEGQTLAADSIAAEIDCRQLLLQRDQVRASARAIDERTTEAKPQLSILREEQRATEAELAVQAEQRKVLERERLRFAKLVETEAVPTKQLTDIEGQLSVLDRQMASTRAKMAITRQRSASYKDQVALQNRATESERSPTEARIASIEDQITKCQVRNPVAGTVLTKYAEQFEFATPGKPLYRIADLDNIELRAYVTGDQLPRIKLNQPVRVFIDAGRSAFRELPGTLVWVADKAEFTPKTIQTKSERSNLVYAVKIRVKNDGSLKIGMYAEVSF
jgi:HlyD family secretion protein